jgi:hypothetical protein
MNVLFVFLFTKALLRTLKRRVLLPTLKKDAIYKKKRNTAKDSSGTKTGSRDEYHSSRSS